MMIARAFLALLLLLPSAGSKPKWRTRFRAVGYPPDAISMETVRGKNMARQAAYDQASRRIVVAAFGTPFRIQGEKFRMEMDRRALATPTVEKQGEYDGGWYVVSSFRPRKKANAVGEGVGTVLDYGRRNICYRTEVLAMEDAVKRYLRKRYRKDAWESRAFTGKIYLVAIGRDRLKDNEYHFTAQYHVLLK